MGDAIQVFIDVETTGFVPFGSSIIALSAIVADGFKEKKRFTLYCKPLSKKYWSVDAEKIHGFSWYKANKFPEPEKFIKNFLGELDSFRQKDNWPLEFWYHGIRKFDYIKLYELFFMFRSQYRLNKLFSLGSVYSTIPLVKKSAILPNYKLNTCAKHFGIKLNHHDAESDCNAAYELWKRSDKIFI